MAGVRGRSGGARRGAGRLRQSADVHRLRGTFRPDRHGPRTVGAKALAGSIPKVTLDAIGHLQPDTQRWVSDVSDVWVLDEHHQRLLQLAGEAWDQAQSARAILATEGLTVPTAQGGSKPHPCVAIATAARAQFATLLAQLDLDDAGAPGGAA